MMHLDDEQLQRLLHGERTASTVARHVAECGSCGARLVAAGREERDVYALLRSIDRPPPVVPHAWNTTAGAATADIPRGPAIVAAHRPAGRWPATVRWAATTLLAVGLAGAAYATPGSPVPQWLRAVAGRANAPAVVAAPVSPTPLRAPETQLAGLAVEPGAALVIVFAEHQRVGEARVLVSDGANVVVRAPSGAATFTAEAERVLIDNRGSDASFDIELPRLAPRIEIRIGARRIFLKQGAVVSTGRSGPAASGASVLSLVAPRQ